MRALFLLISCISLSSSALANVGSVSTGSQSNTYGTIKIVNVSDADLTYVSNKIDPGAFINYPQFIPTNSTANIGLVCERYDRVEVFLEILLTNPHEVCLESIFNLALASSAILAVTLMFLNNHGME